MGLILRPFAMLRVTHEKKTRPFPSYNKKISRGGEKILVRNFIVCCPARNHANNVPVAKEAERVWMSVFCNVLVEVCPIFIL